MKKFTTVLTVVFAMFTLKSLRKIAFGTSFQEESTRVFLTQIHNRYIRSNVQNSESPRDAAIMVVQDALELAGAGKIIGRITDIILEKGMYIVKYEIFGEKGSVSYMPNVLRVYPFHDH